MARESYPTTIAGWRRFLDALDEELAKAPHMEKQVAALAALYLRAQQLVNERDAHRVAMQTATRELQETLRTGRVTSTYLQSAVKTKLGVDSEQLVRFGITRSRDRYRRKKAADPQD
jgi:hypothetical protein